MIPQCEFEHWTVGPDGPPGYGVYYCFLDVGHRGPHECVSTCGFSDPNYPPRPKEARHPCRECHMASVHKMDCSARP